MRGWIEWLSDNALTAGSHFHECVRSAMPEDEPLPTAETLLFGCGTDVLTDTRFGEYQVGMSISFSRQVPLGSDEYAEMCEVAASREFELRIARCMEERNVDYFGRLAMLEDPRAAAERGSPPALITALRYGSIDDARRGTAVVRERMGVELGRWFGGGHTSLLGTATQVLEL